MQHQAKAFKGYFGFQSTSFVHKHLGGKDDILLQYFPK